MWIAAGTTQQECLGEVEHADYLQDFPILLLQLLPRKYAASRMLGNCTHEDTEHSACTCSCHAWAHSWWYNEYNIYEIHWKLSCYSKASQYCSSPHGSSSHSTAFQFELIGWVYFQATSYPLQQLVCKQGGGIIFKGGRIIWDYSNKLTLYNTCSWPPYVY